MTDALVAPNGRRRARALGIPFRGTPGPLNAITDVPGVTVGVTTLIEADGPVRTGVTAILPRPAGQLLHPVWSGVFSMNGNGELTGAHWVRDGGWSVGPIAITNTASLGLVHHGINRWMMRRFAEAADDLWLLPVVGETYDGWLNDICGLHVTEDHVFAALDGASAGPVAEGNVGGGTGMIAYEYKGGTGTASRRVRVRAGDYTVGGLVQANHGRGPWLEICGRRIGEIMPPAPIWSKETGSIIVILATDAPLLPGQLERLARRAAIGIGRHGTPSGNSSGDIFFAFTTANDPGPLPEPALFTLNAIANDDLDAFYMAAVEIVEEAVVNAMVAAETMVGRKGRVVPAIDPDRLAALFTAGARG
ncbi:P1 family peptidase [Zavarzinia compransoris]|uniref:Aminopeptidase n=1 Tax=Zavarzinia compransoris TaxID=1264899 RepID=A0A317E0W9_9PROT|nr:P1 family peptidase [Zavarzinia compransoris]PWR19013.1 aminopeptidase [Zavarzinia compransoris]TDP49016.1 L-aminopeptidase DmpA [Zavarzinia compransoris]